MTPAQTPWTLLIYVRETAKIHYTIIPYGYTIMLGEVSQMERDHMIPSQRASPSRIPKWRFVSPTLRCLAA